MTLQLELLKPLAARIADWLDVDEVPVVHRALLPAAESGLELSPHQMITWEEVLEAYLDVAPPYWLQMLSEALNRYGDLVTRAVANDDARMTGEEILNRYEAGTLPYTAMGRSSGWGGATLREDLETGRWRQTSYQIAVSGPGNRNWFAIEDFIAAVRATEEDPIAALRSTLEQAQSVGIRIFGEGSVAQSIADADPSTLAGANPGELRRVAARYRAAIEAAQEARRSASNLFDLLAKPGR